MGFSSCEACIVQYARCAQYLQYVQCNTMYNMYVCTIVCRTWYLVPSKASFKHTPHNVTSLTQTVTFKTHGSLPKRAEQWATKHKHSFPTSL